MDAPLNRLHSQRGFTLLELLVVTLVVGVLAAIALPMFLSQQEKGKDATAKSAARNLAAAVESCEKGEQDYRDCDSAAELAGEPGGVAWGALPGQARVVTAAAHSFEIESVSKGKSGPSNNSFLWTRGSTGTVSRTCTGTAGCRAGTW